MQVGSRWISWRCCCYRCRCRCRTADEDDGNGLLRYALRFWAQKENVDGDVDNYMYLNLIRDQVGMAGDVELFVLSILT